ncbi:hypothetical protein [Providencia rettgeri]|uniref:hypothetical protein n=1 Tax=Providencia rettgeri TaxID=587 RepID=UPI00205B4C62|nr:hypothetical protein M0M83_07710 [Providencia rettgeri]
MLKKTILGLMFVPLLATSSTKFNGLYRDENFNLMSYQGVYECQILPLPKDVMDTKSYSDKVIGSASVNVENDGQDKILFVNLNNGKNIDIPKLRLVDKGSNVTNYGYRTNELMVVYTLNTDFGVMIGIQNKNKGNELSILLDNCYMVRNHETGAPADP